MSTDNDQLAILNSLNKAQRRAVTSQAPTVAILAGPGSGKTHTLTSRVVWLIQQTGYLPANIIVATFTVKAAREMKERIGKTLGVDMQNKIVLGTFHSIARRYLASYGKRIGLDPKFGIADDGDSRAIIKRICKRLDLAIEPSYAKNWISKKKARGDDAAVAEKGKKQHDHPALQTCFQEYQDHMQRSNLLDYDDLLVKCVELLREHPSCVSNVQAVLIDEYQDTNGIQYQLTRLFAQARQRITIVGDPDQSIYGWRSAEIRNLYRLLRDYPHTDEVSLEENYRSSQSILNVSLNVIQQDKNRYKKVLLPVHTKGSRPVLRKLKSSSAEGEWIVTELKRVVTMCGQMIKYEDVAILLRSASLSRQIESALGKAGIAYRMVGGHKFYERKEIKVLIDYLRVVHQPNVNDAVARIINVPRRGFGEATIKSLLEEAEEAKMTLWAVICKHCHGERKAKSNIRKQMETKLNLELINIIMTLRKKSEQITEGNSKTLVDLVDQLIGLLNFPKYLEEEYPDDHEQRWSNVREFTYLVGDFVKDYGCVDEDALPDVNGLEQTKEDSVLGRFLANVALASDAQMDNKGEKAASTVTISTIHAAKGLEWPVVFVPSVYDGSIPHSRSEDSDEERRLLYVAMTRAQALLYLSCPMYGSQGLSNKVTLSPFVEPFAEIAFAEKGPSFDRPLLESTAKILGREAVAQKVIFDKLPPMFSLEDDLFPANPWDPDNADDEKDDFHRAPKRKRLTYGSGNGTDRTEPTAEEVPFERQYSTTMEQASKFTVSTLPGFISAAAHEAAHPSVATNVVEKQSSRKSGQRNGPTSRADDQKTLLGFVKRSSGSSSAAAGVNERVSATSSAGRYQATMARAQNRQGHPPQPHRPIIEATMAQHRLPTGVSLAHPTKRKEPSAAASHKPYACFSSSPTKPPSPDNTAEKEAEAAPPVQRAATTFHSTTFSGSGANGVFRRPIGMGAAPSLSRLQKPFKPLTIKRPEGPHN